MVMMMMMYVCGSSGKCCIIAAVYVCMYVCGGTSGYVLHYCSCVCMYVCIWFIWLSVALLQQCMYVVHLAKYCVIAAVYICGSSG